MRTATNVTQTIILAAGTGTRLGSAELGVPKPLMCVGGQPLVALALAHAAASGCREAVIVVGHAGDRVQRAIEALESPLTRRFVETPDPSRPNGHSLLSAEPLAAPVFFLQMVDHVFASTALPRLCAAPLGSGEAGRVLVDRAPVDLDLEDATRVRLNGDWVTAIGKHIEPWDAIDAGCFVLTPAVFEALRAVPPGEPKTVSSSMRRLAASRALGAVDIDGIRWVDVDTPADCLIAERLVAAAAPAATAP